MYRPGGPFAREHDEWINEWARAGIGRTQLLVMLKLCERLEFDDYGHVTSWYPRGELARDLGMTEGAVREAVQKLKRHGFLKVKEAGSRGSATLYTVMPHTKWPRQRGVSEDHPNEKKGGLDDAHRVVSEDHPLRINSGGGTADADRRPDTGPANSFWEAAVNAPDRDEFERRHDEAEKRRRAGGPPE